MQRLPAWDHPRACGEKLRSAQALEPWLGSPPRMRGKALEGVKFNTVARITPAHAGKSCGFAACS